MAGIGHEAHPPSSRMPGASTADAQGGWLGDHAGFASLGVAFGQCLVVYYGAAVLLHYVVPAVMGRVSRVQKAPQKHQDTMRDAARSVLPLLIKSLTLFAGEWLHRRGHGRMDDRRLVDVAGDPVQLVQMLGWVLALDIFHDAWFYWTHKLLHTRWMLRNVHYMHHQSHNPSAFTGYSFHWLEACMVFSVAIGEIYIFPIPLALQRAYELWMIAIHLGGHCGYEIQPHAPHLVQALGLVVTFVLGVGPGCLSSVVNNVEHHDMHHQNGRYHLSLYFTHWDYLMGTIHPDYAAKHPHSLLVKPRGAASVPVT
mmetsp:Transcript_21832/g.42390  ORF Transcript_21832/g.42390 Transcript_21832/m.42390 type:complete len:311 (-) Transcript_21832:298-1230(-)